jgi:hypothetical protein
MTSSMRARSALCLALFTLTLNIAGCAGNSGSVPPSASLQQNESKRAQSVTYKRNLAGVIDAYIRPNYSNGGGGGGGGTPTTFSGSIGSPVVFYAQTSDGSSLSNCTFDGMPSYPTIVGGYTPGSPPVQLSTSTSSFYLEFYFTAPTTGEATATCDDEADGGVITTAPLDYTVSAPRR